MDRCQCVNEIGDIYFYFYISLEQVVDSERLSGLMQLLEGGAIVEQMVQKPNEDPNQTHTTLKILNYLVAYSTL